MTPFEKLKQDFPVFKVFNKTAVSKHIQLANGEDVQIQSNSFGSINSSELTQIPDMRSFRMESPSTSDLIAYGVLEKKVAPTPPAPVVPEKKTVEVDPK